MDFEVMLTSKTLIFASVVVLIFILRGRIKRLVISIADSIVKRVFAFNMQIFTRVYNKSLYSRKKELFSSLGRHLESVRGDILEIGAGTGANFEFYPDGCSVVALDPNVHMNYYLLRNKNLHPHVNLKEWIVGSAEDMGKIEDLSVSAVVATLMLCSVESLDRTLKEVIRVLKPGGRLYFMEHVKGKGGLLKFQQIIEPVWYYLNDGCFLTRETEEHIRKAGFKNVQCESFDASIHPLIKPHIMGYAEV